MSDMEENEPVRKIIFSVLDALLIFGAMMAVFSIDQGRWLISNPAFYTPPEEAAPVTPLLAAQDAAPGQAMIPGTGGGACPTAGKLATTGWYEAHRLAAAYQTVEMERGRPVAALLVDCVQ